MKNGRQQPATFAHIFDICRRFRSHAKGLTIYEFVERLLRGFRSDTERLVAAIRDALVARRYEDVKDAAHALKGGAGSVGATQLVSLALRFENATYDTMRIKTTAWTDELSRAADNVLQALETHLEERRKQQSSSS